MNILLQRQKQQHELLLGKLYINNEPICDTLENIHAALPPGTYPIVRHYCKQQNRQIPLLITPDTTFMEIKCKHCQQLHEPNNNTPHPCYCPQLKAGNGIHHIHDGRILVGKQLVPQCLIQTQTTFNKLYNRIRKQSSRGKSITLIIP